MSQDELIYSEVLAQPYIDTRLSAGLVYNHPVDTIYLRLERDNEQPTTILLRRDEVMALICLLAGALWSDHYAERDEEA